jgi:hypothetical protein
MLSTALSENRMRETSLGISHYNLAHSHLENYEVEVKLRPTVSLSVCLGVRHPSGTHDQIFYLL